MPNITNCSSCHSLYEAGSEEQANDPDRLCPPCFFGAEQQKLCEEQGFPHFAPLSGRCFTCGKDATDEEWIYDLQTGCKHCHRSWCE